MPSFLNFLLGNGAANLPGNVMRRGLYRGLGGTGGIAGPSGMPPVWSTPPFLPTQSNPPRTTQPMKPPASLMDKLTQLATGGNPMFDLGMGLLAAGGPRPAGTGNFGADLASAVGFASQRQDARSQREEIQRQLEEIERQKQASAQLTAQLDKFINAQTTGANPRFSQDQASLLSALAQSDPTRAFGMMAGIPGILGPAPAPELTDAGRKTRELREAGHELTESQELELYGLGPDATEDDLDKILSTSDLESYRLSDGSKLRPGSTLRDAMNAGALPYTAAEITQQRAAESGATTLEMLEDLALGKDGVFINAGGGAVTNSVPGRVTRGMANATGTFFGTDASRQRDLYNRTRKAYIASLARSRGETGNLSDADIERISLALPELGAVPMTEDQARAMFSEARKIYGGSNKTGGQSRGGSRSGPIDLGGGVTIQF